MTHVRRASRPYCSRSLFTQFAADMAGFDVDEIVDVQPVLLDPTSFSPIQ